MPRSVFTLHDIHGLRESFADWIGRQIESRRGQRDSPSAGMHANSRWKVYRGQRWRCGLYRSLRMSDDPSVQTSYGETAVFGPRC